MPASSSPAAPTPTTGTKERFASGSASLAEEHVRRLGISSTFVEGYTESDALAVLQGKPVPATAAEMLHNKLACIVGIQITSRINSKHPGLGWTPERFLVRAFDGESSARPLSFSDGSRVVLISRALQETVICLTNILVHLDISIGLARLSRHRRRRERQNFEATAHMTAILRYLILGQRMTGNMPRAPAALDDQSVKIAGEMAVGALMFVVAHEIAHIVLGHTDPPTNESGIGTNVGRELQADNWAFGFLAKQKETHATEDSVLWDAFIGLFATHLAEHGLYVRRNREHPEAWARWAVLQKMAGHTDSRSDGLRVAFMAGVGGAMELREPIPRDLWPLLWKDAELTIAPVASQDVVEEWDRLQTSSIETLVSDARRSATTGGRQVLDALEAGLVSDVIARLVPSERRRARILDPSAGLEFSTLREAFEQAASSLTEESNALYPVAGTRLAAHYLHEAQIREQRTD